MSHHPFRAAPLRLMLTLGLGLSFLAACSDDDDDNGGGGGPAASTTYVGLVASTDGQTGPLNITFASPVATPPAPQDAGAGPSESAGVPVNATGTMSLGGGPVINLTGTIDDDFLAMSGGGYDLLGDLNNGLIVGGFSNAGIVLIEGSFVAASSSSESPALAFCGTFEGQDAGDPPTPNSGTFNLVIAGGIAAGVAVDDEGNAIPIQGTSTSSSISINQTDPDSGGNLTATGTYNGTTLSGTFTVTLGGIPISTGAFTGSICSQST